MKHITFKSAFMAMALVCSGVAFTACEDDIEVLVRHLVRYVRLPEQEWVQL